MMTGILFCFFIDFSRQISIFHSHFYYPPQFYYMNIPETKILTLGDEQIKKLEKESFSPHLIKNLQKLPLPASYSHGFDNEELIELANCLQSKFDEEVKKKKNITSS